MIQKATGSRDPSIGLPTLVSGRSVLDVGCGPDPSINGNDTAIETARHYVGLDASEAFVQAADLRFSSSSSLFVLGQATALPFADGSFDVVALQFTIHHVQEPPVYCLTEARRVARDCVVVFDHLRSDSSPFWRAIQDAYWRVADGGFHYLTWRQWAASISAAGMSCVTLQRSGLLGRHVIKMVLR